MLMRGREKLPARPWLQLATVALAAAGCASPASRFRDDASARGFEIQQQTIADTTLVTIANVPSGSLDTIHFYLDGDGLPWLSRRRIAADPTTRERLVLDLMSADAAPAVLVGRPCYYLENNACDAVDWTAGRYDEHTVAALAAQLNREIKHYAGASITLIGYSGGGTLAMLVAPRLQRLDTLVTVAANLDVAAWASHHGYAPLSSSLDPADAPPLDARIRQVHLFGEGDHNVPAELVRHVADRQLSARVVIMPGYDHRCCWARDWPQLLRTVIAARSDP